MYVNIVRDNMTIPHKHPSYKVCCNLSWIELQGKTVVTVDSDSHNFLADFTDMEMKLLYRNITEEDVVGWIGPSLRSLIGELVYRMEETEINAFQLELQAGKVVEGQINMKYALGSNEPCHTQYLFPECLKADAHDDQPTIAAWRRSYYKETSTNATYTRAVLPARSATRTSTAPRTTRAASSATAAPRQGGVREIIWKVADQIWEADGKPNDKHRVLELRKRMMNELEQQGVKRTSSSNELGNWAKVRVQ